MCCGVGIVWPDDAVGVGRQRERRSDVVCDINVFNLNSLEKTLEGLDSAKVGNVEFEVLLSKNLAGIPTRGQFDLVVSNPPHFDAPRSRRSL